MPRMPRAFGYMEEMRGHPSLAKQRASQLALDPKAQELKVGWR